MKTEYFFLWSDDYRFGCFQTVLIDSEPDRYNTVIEARPDWHVGRSPFPSLEETIRFAVEEFCKSHPGWSEYGYYSDENDGIVQVTMVSPEDDSE